MSRILMVVVILNLLIIPNLLQQPLMASSYEKDYPLHFFCKYTKLYQENDVIKSLNEIIKNGADINMKDGKGNLPIHLALHSKRFIIADYLIKNGSDLNKKNSRGRTPLHIASYLLARQRRSNDIGARTRRALGAELYMVQLLIKNGANINEKNSEGKTPFFLAMHRADFSWGIKDLPVEKFITDKINLYYQNGANVNMKTNIGTTLLHQTLSQGDYLTATLLLNMCKDINVNIKDKRGKTPLDDRRVLEKNTFLSKEERKNLENIIELLLKKGAK